MFFKSWFVNSGSPPQVRGKLSCRKTYTLSWGITPAGAGKTRRYAGFRSSNRDHPRRCGENCFVQKRRYCNRGSPPQVRGKRKPIEELPGYSGITPAGAGKTGGGGATVCVAEDHPRRCGENRVHQGFACPVTGSPPQVRGKHRESTGTTSKGRITPADAGKTQTF